MLTGKMVAQKALKQNRLKVEIENNLPYLHEYSENSIKNEFSRDRDRILFSRAFRRLEHKAQIYSHERGDHFRTRLTHTLEVAQVARSLARNLNLNEDLVEAISLGHDIGHTPYGHQGERTLDLIMSGNDNLSGKIKISVNYGGFKHNLNSLKILDIFEKKYEHEDGLNLTWQVMEGILKHTRIKRHKESECKIRLEKNCGKRCIECYDIGRFVKDRSILERLFLDQRFSVTLEGQVVAIADEIAQRQHDLDDGMRDVQLGLKTAEVYNKIIGYANRILEDYDNNKKSEEHGDYGSKQAHTKESISLLRELKNKLEVKSKSSDKFYMKNALIKDVIEYFILDVTGYSLKNIMNLVDTDYSQFDENIILKKQVISFSEEANALNRDLETYINNQIVNSFGVNRFDGKAIYIVRQLFKAYYTNPRQMPGYVLERLHRGIKENSKIYNLKLFEYNNKNLDEISFKYSSREEINLLIQILKLEAKLDSHIKVPEYFGRQYFKNISAEEINRLCNMSIDEVKYKTDEERFIKCLLENNYLFLSTICQYIAGMTDNYANGEYKALYVTN